MLDKYLHILCEKEHILNSRLTLEFFELEHLIILIIICQLKK